MPFKMYQEGDPCTPWQQLVVDAFIETGVEIAVNESGSVTIRTPNHTKLHKSWDLCVGDVLRHKKIPFWIQGTHYQSDYNTCYVWQERRY